MVLAKVRAYSGPPDAAPIAHALVTNVLAPLAPD